MGGGLSVEFPVAIGGEGECLSFLTGHIWLISFGLLLVQPDPWESDVSVLHGRDHCISVSVTLSCFLQFCVHKCIRTSHSPYRATSLGSDTAVVSGSPGSNLLTGL